MDLDVITIDDARENFDDVVHRAVEDSTAVAVARPRAEAVVIVSKSYWDSLHETLHVLGTPENARLLRKSIAELDAGHGVERELIEP